jgi:hypothetical protein
MSLPSFASSCRFGYSRQPREPFAGPIVGRQEPHKRQYDLLRKKMENPSGAAGKTVHRENAGKAVNHLLTIKRELEANVGQQGARLEGGKWIWKLPGSSGTGFPKHKRLQMRAAT